MMTVNWYRHMDLCMVNKYSSNNDGPFDTIAETLPMKRKAI